METKIFWLVGLAVAAVAALFAPTPYIHRSITPAEDPKYVRRLFADYTVGQVLHSRFQTDYIRIAVRAKELSYDQWIKLKLPHSLPPGDHEITLSAPRLASQSDAILIRFQVDSTTYEPGYMTVAGKPSYGDIAFQLEETIPAWQQVTRYFSVHPNHRPLLLQILVLAFGLASLAYGVPRRGPGWRWALVMLFLLAFLIRLPTLFDIDGVFGGDALNYLSKAKAWLGGSDPFSAEPRKGPFLPLLLTPTFLTNDPLVWSRALGAGFAAAGAVLLAMLLHRLKISAPLAILGGLLLAVNREFWWESLNGLANVPYATLILASTLAFVSSAPAATSTLSALGTLTRYEGLLVALIYIPALWFRQRLRLSLVRSLLVPGVLLLAIPFVFWPLSGVLGVRTVSDITSDTGLYIAWDWPDYLANLNRLKFYLQTIWFSPHIFPFSALNTIFHVASVTGALLILKKRPAVAVPIILIALSQAAVITYILPKTRYYIPLVPFLVVGLVFAMNYLPRRLAPAVLSLFVAAVWLNSIASVPSLVENYNNRSQADSVLIQASKFLRNNGGKAAFATNFFTAETYLSREQFFPGPPQNPDGIMRWLQEKDIEYIVETDQHPWFAETISQSPDRFELINSYRSISGDAHAQLYHFISH